VIGTCLRLGFGVGASILARASIPVLCRSLRDEICAVGRCYSLGRRRRGEQGLDAKVRELTIIALVSCFSLGLAWAYEADFFAILFAAAAAIAGVEAVRRSL
jgi:hypothetical protein